MHDKHGKPLNEGDEVIVRFRVKDAFPDQNEPNLFCNCNLESVEPMPGNGVFTTLSAINTRQVEKVRPGTLELFDEEGGDS